MYLLTFAIILVIVLIISLISYVFKELRKPKGERFDIKGQIKHRIYVLKHLNKHKIKNFFLKTAKFIKTIRKTIIKPITSPILNFCETKTQLTKIVETITERANNNAYLKFINFFVFSFTT